MKFLFPKRRQWQRWSAPSKLTYLGTLVGILGLILSLISLFLAKEQETADILTEPYDPQKELMFIGDVNFEQHLKDRQVPREQFPPFIRSGFDSVVNLLAGCYVVHRTEATMIAGFRAEFFPHGGFIRIDSLGSEGLTGQIAFRVAETYSGLNTISPHVLHVRDPYDWPLLTDQNRQLGMVLNDEVGLFADLYRDILTVEGVFNDGSYSWVRFQKVSCP